MVNTTLVELTKEVRLLRSLLIGLIGRDREGNYHPEFVKRVLATASEKPKYEFLGKGSLSTHLHKASQ